VIEERKPTRVVIDSLSELQLLADSPLRYRRQVLALKQFFASRSCTVMMLDDRTAAGRALAFFGQQPDMLKSLYNLTRNNQVVAEDTEAMREALKEMGVRTDPIVRSLVKDVKRGAGRVYDPGLPSGPAPAVTEAPTKAVVTGDTSKVYNDGGGYSYWMNDDGSITMVTAPGKTGETKVQPGEKGYDAIKSFIDKQDAAGSTGLDTSVWQQSKQRAEGERQKKLADLARKAEPMPVEIPLQPTPMLDRVMESHYSGAKPVYGTRLPVDEEEDQIRPRVGPSNAKQW
jgi:hypothetical protein